MTIKKRTSRKQPDHAPLSVSEDARIAKHLEIAEKTHEVQESGENPETGFPIIGIGASAGGLAAFEAFFSGMPKDTDPGMAFVLIQHLAPDHKSLLTDLIQRFTRMQVFEVEDGMTVRPNCVYIIPPNRDMAFLNGKLQLLEPFEPRGQRLPIGFFFRSLAQDQHERAICIILSGTGSDGTMGIRAIKGEGGMVMVQKPESSEYDGMPRSAIATGLVDYELPPAGMPTQLIAYATQAYDKLSQSITSPSLQSENALRTIFVLLRAKTGHDFSGYKTNTIYRRIIRRMTVNQIETIWMYVKVLQQTPQEVESLFRDLLIGVTNFFRDSEAFEALEEKIIPRIFTDKPAGSVIRVWSAGCSTGEEAYSLAILLQEHVEILESNYRVQVFATDLDCQAVATARAGIYPASIASDISPERLARFFTAEPGDTAYRINKSIRDLLVFSEQNVVRDPPFSKLDLISCRNLIIYIGEDLQKKLLPLFHYALNPGGFLFLGTSETVGDFSTMFSTMDRKLKLYQRRDDFHRAHNTGIGQFVPPLTTTDGLHPQFPAKKADTGKLSIRELTEQTLLQQVAPAGAMVNDHGDILYLHGRTGMYLEPAPGETGSYNILNMAREGLRPALTTALHKAAGNKETVYRHGLRVKTNGDFTLVDLTIHPVVTTANTSQPPLYLVILEEAISSKPVSSGQSLDANEISGINGSVHIAALRRELHAKEEYLQTANEELKSSNEEMQSVNEELQSTNEELETSKEEMQSVNEELATVNTELHTKLRDLSRANNDMNNLLAGTGIATVFVDHQLRILRFTPAATGIINLILSDLGRPVGHIVSNLVSYDRLVADAQTVLSTLIPKEVEVQTNESKWYTMRIHPYLTLDNIIEGIVISFVDITELKTTREALRKTHTLSRLAIVVHDTQDAMTVQDLDGRILAWNPAAERIYGWSEAEALTMNIRELIPEGLREESLATIEKLSRAEVLKPYRTQRIAKDGRSVEVSMVSTALMNQANQMYAIATTERMKRLKAARNKRLSNDQRR